MDSFQGTEDLVLHALQFRKMGFYNKFLGGFRTQVIKRTVLSYILKAVVSVLSVCNCHAFLSSVSSTVRRLNVTSTSNAACNFDSYQSILF